MQQNYKIVPSNRGSEFKWLVKQLLNINASLDQFQKNVDALLSECPQCKSWLNWYLHHDRARMIFQVLVDDKFMQADPNTNAQICKC